MNTAMGTQPWHWEKLPSSDITPRIAEWTLVGPTVLCRFWYDSPPDSDARLIAAAPAMLEALEGITKAFDCAYRAALDPSIYDSRAEWEEAIATNSQLMRAKAAIRLAKGESL